MLQRNEMPPPGGIADPLQRDHLLALALAFQRAGDEAEDGMSVDLSPFVLR